MHAPPPRQVLEPGLQIACHRHDGAYLTVVLRGSYEEAGEHGRRRLGPGDVARHGMFSCHRNSIAASGAVVLNLPAAGVGGVFGRLDDPDAVAAVAVDDPRAAAALAARQLVTFGPQILDWPDELAAALAADPQISLSDWAERRGLAPETLSRGFGRTFGLPPKRFRHEVKMRRALAGTIETAAPLAQVALDAGFADQAQMSRAISALTGASPGVWRRRSSGDKTAA
ncbi:MAG: AraC family transcriptional regulator [Phenylobacterium sp.]|uniref:helix-turn-helix domain-containing protein n=1 Tax=Phenylobacterium sp. TaxID=1871053 RepID=UPI0025CC7D65|nr:AraC family transcriptional regulator [Phenylobacterium sp.]MBA4013079.1 AraC family transcriptional regulator [Phenylobacterium sp.]